jgi:hypothetical protein
MLMSVSQTGEDEAMKEEAGMLAGPRKNSSGNPLAIKERRHETGWPGKCQQGQTEALPLKPDRTQPSAGAVPIFHSAFP